MNCEEITNHIKTLSANKDDFDNALAKGKLGIVDAFDIKARIESLFANELKEILWPFEILTKDEVKKQYSSWQETYREIGITESLPLPSIEQLLNYLSNDAHFTELLKTKEKQGFTKIVISPAPYSIELKTFINKLNAKIRESGGDEMMLSGEWKAALAAEDKIKYFCNLVDDKPTGGYTSDEIKSHPENFGILDGWMIAFVEDRQDIVMEGELDVIDSTGRASIKGGKKAQEYQELYFSDQDSHYIGEKPVIPQEWLALFANDLYAKYLKEKKPMGQIVPDLLNANTATWFTSVSSPLYESLPFMKWWSSGIRKLSLNSYRPMNSTDNLAPRASVRKSS